MNGLVPVEIIEKKILLIRGEKVMLDSDLAGLYEVSVKVLNQAVKRNIGRFPEDFMFQLTKEENESLRSQLVTLKTLVSQKVRVNEVRVFGSRARGDAQPNP